MNTYSRTNHFLRAIALPILILAFGVSLTGCGEQRADNGGKYVTIDRQAPTSPLQPGEIEVVEFFSYGCSHCRDFEPYLAAWSKRLPANVRLVRVPVAFVAQQVPLQNLFYALESVRASESVHQAAFAAIHDRQEDLTSAQTQSAFVQDQGLDVAAFEQALDAVRSNAKADRANELTRAYKIEGTPALCVGGRYVVSPSAGVQSWDEMLQVADELIRKSR